jgi:uncharacterized protein (DUF1330 family)
MASYILSIMQKHDLDKYTEYAAQGFVSLDGIEVEALVCDDVEALEGASPGSSLVMMKFPDNETAKKWYHSPAYQKAIPLRHAAADTGFVVHFTDEK